MFKRTVAAGGTAAGSPRQMGETCKHPAARGGIPIRIPPFRAGRLMSLLPDFFQDAPSRTAEIVRDETVPVNGDQPSIEGSGRAV